MKKLITILLLLSSTVLLKAQCSASFGYQSDPMSGLTTFSGYANVTDSNAYPITYFWSFGDGTSGTGQFATHQYNANSGYLVCLTITTSDSCTSTYCDSVVTGGTTPTAGCLANFYFYTDSMTVPPLTIYNFVDQSSADSLGTITSWLWDFGNGTTSTQQNPTASFATGTYTVCLTISTSNGCAETYCQTITVNNTGCQLYANFTSQSPTTIGGNDGFIESSISGGTVPYTYYWSNGATTANIYNLTSGAYTLNVVDAIGCQGTFTEMLYEPYDTTGGIIIDTLTTNILDSCLNFIPDSFYIASVTTDPNTNTVVVVWVFVGGGMTSTFTMTYSYTSPGNYAVVLTINCGTKALTTYTSYIHIYETAGILPNYGNETEILAYPVPFNDHINISSFGSGKINISLYDATGRLAKAEPTFVSNGAFLKEINTSGLPSGMYILSIEINGAIVHKQVIK